jgi:hypothetical protein
LFHSFTDFRVRARSLFLSSLTLVFSVAYSVCEFQFHTLALSSVFLTNSTMPPRVKKTRKIAVMGFRGVGLYFSPSGLFVFSLLFFLLFSMHTFVFLTFVFSHSHSLALALSLSVFARSRQIVHHPAVCGKSVRGSLSSNHREHLRQGAEVQG